MKFPSLNPYYRTALLLIIMAGVLILAAIVTDISDFTSAELVVAGLVCLLTGVFFTTLSGSDPLDLRYICLFSAQNCISLTRICAELGIQGSASIIPKGRDGRVRTMHFLPVTEYNGEPIPTGTFITGPDTAGILTEPSCMPLLHLLKEQEHLHIPSDMAALQGLVRELGEDVLEVAGKVRSTHDGESITITMEDFRLIGGCRVMADESPRCCTAYPCPICSLFATVFAEGTVKVIQLERCAPDPKHPKVTMVFVIRPE